MKQLIKLLTEDLANQLSQQLEAGIRQAVIAIIGALLLFIGAGVLLYAAFLYMSVYMPPRQAALIIGAAFVVVGGLVMLALKRNDAPVEPKKSETGEEKAPDNVEIVALLEAQAESYIRSNAKSATLLALLAGTVTGASPDLRRALLSLLEREMSRNSRPKPPPGDAD